jgi:hypothetical protein
VAAAAAAPVQQQAPGSPLAPPPPPGSQQPRRPGAFSAWLAANTVLAAVIAIVIVAAGGTGIYLAATRTTPTPTAAPSPTARPSSSPTPVPVVAFNPTAALLTKTDLGPGTYTNDGAAEALSSWACAPADPTTTTATGSANILYTSSFTDSQGTNITLAIANYTYVFPSTAAAAAFMQAADTIAKHCTANGATLPTPPQAGDLAFRCSYENSDQGDNDLVFVQVKNGVSVMISASSADQWELFDSTIQTMASNAADDLTTAQGG